MVLWICTALVALISSVTGTAVAVRSYLLAVYLWRETGDIGVLRQVADFERRIRDSR